MVIISIIIYSIYIMDERIIKQLIKFNVEQQIQSRMELCKQDQTMQMCREVPSNEYNNWYKFYTKDKYNNLFSKGKSRLRSWCRLMKDPPIFEFPNFSPNEDEMEGIETLSNKLVYMNGVNPDCYYFIMSSLMVIFQIFGDGNHRTANFFYELSTGHQFGLSSIQQEKIKKVYQQNDYFTVSKNPIKVLTNIVNELETICNANVGGKRKRTRITRRNRRAKRTRKARRARITKKI
jgi:hypothetical protein